MSSTIITTNKIIELSDCNLESKTLLTGTLLKWIDIIACLAAEKHANVPCVTASVDDLQLQKSIKLGHVLVMKAWINRVFNTSMEIEVSVLTEDTIGLEWSKICQAFFTFVTQPDANGNKQLVKPLIPESEEEKTQFRLANERKMMRLDYRNSLKKLKDEDENDNLGKRYFTKRWRQKSEDVYETLSSNNENNVDPNTTYCECVEIVLPQHCNHHGTTFGGQLMAWMEATGTISARKKELHKTLTSKIRRLCHQLPRLVAVDEVFFRAPSKLGDRIVIKSCVNNTFGKSMEVGVRVEAYAVAGPRRHIQSAYFTFINPDLNGNPKELPKVLPKTNMHETLNIDGVPQKKDVIVKFQEAYHRMMRAEVRVKLRIDRRSILCSSGVSVPFTKYNQKILSYKNILCLMELYNSPCFKMKIQVDDVRLSQCKIDGVLCIRVECEIEAPPWSVYKLLSDHKKRKHWDMFVTDVSVKREIRKNEDCILHYTMGNLKPRDNLLGDDFVVLASTRKDTRDLYMIAYRSVLVDDLPPTAEYHRSENKCSGFVLEPFNSSTNPLGCKLAYINLLTDHVYEYVKNDLQGATDSFAKRAIALKELIKTTQTMKE